MKKNLIIIGLLFYTVLAFGFSNGFIAVSEVQAADWYVTNPADSPVVFGCLRHAIINAHHGDTIYLDSTTYFLNRPLFIQKDLSIIGKGRRRTIIDGNGNGRVFRVATGRKVKIAMVRITGGVGGPWNPEKGGGIYNSGNLVLVRTVVIGNVLDVSGRGYGGGIFNDGNLTLIKSYVIENTTIAGFSFGGGIYNSGDIIIIRSNISENISEAINFGPAYGGGIENSGDLIMRRSKVSGNTAKGHSGIGGGINNDGNITIRRSLVAGNIAEGVYEDAVGGGISTGKNFMITGSRILRNTATGGDYVWGGGIYTGYFEPYQLRNTIVRGNIPDQVYAEF